MKIDASDIADLRPIITAVVAEVLADLQSDEAKLNGKIAFREAEAAALIGVQRHVLRDARLRGEISASRIGKRVIYEREQLLTLLEKNRITR